MKKFWVIVFGLFLCIMGPYVYKTSKLTPIKDSDLPSYGQWAQLSDGNIFFRWFEPEQVTKAEPVILVHGFSTPQFVWDGMVQFITDQGFRVLVYDHFGRGYSERPSGPYNKELFVRSLHELIASQDIKTKIHLVGYSMGGPIVGYFATEYPALVASTSFIAPAGLMVEANGINPLAVAPYIGEWFLHVFGNIASRYQDREDTSDPYSLSTKDFLNLIETQTNYEGFYESLLSTYRNFNLFNTQAMYERLGDFNFPTQIIWGTNDRVVLYSGNEDLIKFLPQAELVTIEDGKHSITYKKPTKVGKSLASFLESISS
jgi:pimeloyl-ACP methyl ester carboxylesterase